jgi:uncharacterized protein (TIGR03118 family)
MKNLPHKKTSLAIILAITCFYACKKDLSTVSENSMNRSLVAAAVPINFTFTQVNIVADTAGYGAMVIDSNLKNAWGMAAPLNGPVWISANHQGVSTIYNRTTGLTLKAPVTIPAAMMGQTGSPSGVVFNSTADFGGNKFIFATEDGILAGWSGGNAAVKVADRSAFNAVYKGITMANDGGANFLYVTNFKGGKIDVFDSNFNYVTTKPFIDPGIPAGYAPFNIQLIGNKLFVTYAKQKGPDNMDDQAGLGNGYVDIFGTNGIFQKRFASNGDLDSPWGIAQAPAGFASDKQNILIGNFGSGRIDVFDTEGVYMGQLHDSQKKNITIDGLWAIDFLKNNVPGGGSPTDLLYFTAGPVKETHGIFGSLQKN